MEQQANLKQKLSDDLKQAMKSGDTVKRSTLRMLMSAINNAEIAKKASREDSDILGVIAKEVKQHQESIESFKQGNRSDLVAKEGPIVNQRDGVLILSEGAGAHQQLAPGAIVISPCDVYATAQALHQALVMSPEERLERAARLRWLIEREDITAWLCRQLETVAELNL